MPEVCDRMPDLCSGLHRRVPQALEQNQWSEDALGIEPLGVEAHFHEDEAMIMFRVQKCYQPFINGKHHDRFTNVLRAAQRYTLTTGKPCIFKAHQLYVVIRRNKLQKHELRHSLTAFGMGLVWPWQAHLQFN